MAEETSPTMKMFDYSQALRNLSFELIPFIRATDTLGMIEMAKRLDLVREEMNSLSKLINESASDIIGERVAEANKGAAETLKFAIALATQGSSIGQGAKSDQDSTPA